MSLFFIFEKMLNDILTLISEAEIAPKQLEKYKKWKTLVNMFPRELETFMNSKKGKTNKMLEYHEYSEPYYPMTANEFIDHCIGHSFNEKIQKEN
jgi:hypothetical protein